MGRRIFIGVAAFLLVLSALGLWQKNNLQALYLYLNYDRQDISLIIDENREKLQKDIAKYGAYLPRDLTAEEAEMLATGDLTVEEATNLLLSDGNKGETSSQSEEDTKGQNLSSNTPSNGTIVNKATDSSGEIIRKYVAHIYSLKAYYMGQLNQIEARARSEYGTMTEKEQKNLSKTAFLKKYMSYANSLMNECDGQMALLLGEMKSELRAVGGDLSVITTIKQSYEFEKAAQKAYYLSFVS